jgi:hypothetical protein
MENIWKAGFIGLLVIAGLGLVMAGLSETPVQEEDCSDGVCDLEVEQETEETVDDESLCSGGCGEKLGSCGADCGCGCQKQSCDSLGCEKSICGGDCPRALGCGCN